MCRGGGIPHPPIRARSLHICRVPPLLERLDPEHVDGAHGHVQAGHAVGEDLEHVDDAHGHVNAGRSRLTESIGFRRQG
jgi:hypothetical protein